MLNSENCKVKGFGIINGLDNGVEVNGVRTQNCNNVEISGVTILNNNGRVCFNAQSKNILIDNVKAIGDVYGDQTDAIDIYSCEDVVVKRCFAYGNDDTYCIKSWKWSYKGETKNIHFEDCIARNVRGNSFEIGYEVGCGVSNVTYKDIYSIHSSGGSANPLRRGAVTIHDAAAGHIHNISYENVYIEDPLEFGIDIRIAKAGYELGTGEVYGPGIIDNVKMKNVYMLKQAPLGNTLMGYDNDHKISIEFENLYIAGKKITSAKEGQFSCTFTDVVFK
jgi:polygalacturonase